MYRLKLARRGLLLSLIIVCTSAGLTAQGYYEPLVIKNSAKLISDDSQALIDAFNADSSVDSNSKAGFIFIPRLVSLNNTAAGGTPERPDTLYARDYLACLSYWGGTNGDSLLLYGLEGDTSIFSYPTPDSFIQSPSYPEVLYLPVTEEDTITNIAKAIIGLGEPIELVFLPMSDYNHLMKDESFYSHAQKSDPNFSDTIRKLIIERSTNGHFFDLDKGPTIIFRNYRSLTFRPNPRPQFGDSDVAAIAYTNGYSCPPRWKKKIDPGQGSLQLNVDSAQSDQPLVAFMMRSNSNSELPFITRPRHHNPLREIQGVAQRIQDNVNIIESSNDNLIRSEVTIWDVLRRNGWNYAIIAAIILSFFFLGRLSKN